MTVEEYDKKLSEVNYYDDLPNFEGKGKEDLSFYCGMANYDEISEGKIKIRDYYIIAYTGGEAYEYLIRESDLKESSLSYKNVNEYEGCGRYEDYIDVVMNFAWEYLKVYCKHVERLYY
jgi:hypothetical protein